MPTSIKNVNNITWAQLKQNFGFGVPAYNHSINGRVSYLDRANQHLSPNIRLCDVSKQTQGAVFFYSAYNNLQSNFDTDNIQLGDQIVIRQPRLHLFADGQQDIRIDDQQTIVILSQRLKQYL